MDFEENKSGRVVARKAQKKVNLKTFITGVLRRASFHWKPRQEAMTAARVSRGNYKCAICQDDGFGPKEVTLDHIDPVVDPKLGFVSWDHFIPRLFCEASGFQVICKSCDSSKTSIEDLMREHYKTVREAIPDLTPDKKYTKSKKKKIDKQEEV